MGTTFCGWTDKTGFIWLMRRSRPKKPKQPFSKTANKCTNKSKQKQSLVHGFYRVMHFSAKHGIAIACRLSVCDVGEL